MFEFNQIDKSLSTEVYYALRHADGTLLFTIDASTDDEAWDAYNGIVEAHGYRIESVKCEYAGQDYALDNSDDDDSDAPSDDELVYIFGDMSIK